MKKRWWVLIVSVPVVGGWMWWGAAHRVVVSAEGEMRMVGVEKGEVKRVVNASGKISPNYEVDIKCKASGEVISLPFDVSDFVKKGDQVMELDPIDEVRAVHQAEAALTGAQCKVKAANDTLQIAAQTLLTDTKQAESLVHQTEVTAADLRARAERTKLLFNDKLESQELRDSDETGARRAELAVDDAKNALEALKTHPIQIEMDQNDVTLAQLDVATAQTNLDDANQRLTETKVKSPIDGVVTTRPAQIGTIVSSGITTVGGGTSVMTLVDLSRLFVLAPVDEADIGKVRREQKVTITCDAFPEKKFEGQILRIAAKGSNMQNVVTFEVKIEVLGEGKELLKPEMTTDVEIVVADRVGVLRVPTEAVKVREADKDKGKKKSRYVLVAVEGAASQPATTAAATMAADGGDGKGVKKVVTAEREVEIGVEDGKFTEIVSGLKEGEKVAIESVGAGMWSKLKAGEE